MTAKNNHGIVICTLLMTLMVVSVAFVLALKADNVYVDGVQQHQPLTASQVTNTVRALQRGTVYGITGITNVWSGTQAAYDGMATHDTNILYLIEE